MHLQLTVGKSLKPFQSFHTIISPFQTNYKKYYGLNYAWLRGSEISFQGFRRKASVGKFACIAKIRLLSVYLALLNTAAVILSVQNTLVYLCYVSYVNDIVLCSNFFLLEVKMIFKFGLTFHCNFECLQGLRLSLSIYYALLYFKVLFVTLASANKPIKWS